MELGFVSAFTLALSALQFSRGKLVKPPKYYLIGMFLNQSMIVPHFDNQRRQLARKYQISHYMSSKDFLATLDHRLAAVDALYKFKYGKRAAKTPDDARETRTEPSKDP